MNEITGPHKRKRKHPLSKKVPHKHAYLVIIYVLFAALTLIWATTQVANGEAQSTTLTIKAPQKAVQAQPEASKNLPDPCSLKDVVCPGEEMVITHYQAVAGQTDSTPCIGAMAGVDFCNPPFPIVANNCLTLGSKVQIEGVTYTVADRMNKRYGCNHYDILTQ